MKTNVVEKGEWERELEVAVPAQRIEAEFTRACRKYQKSLEIPGFRKGKIPLKVIIGRFGESIRQEVVGDMLPGLVDEAARQADLNPSAPPTIDKLDYEPGQDLTFTASLSIWPEIEVETYEGLPLIKMVHPVTEEEVEGQLVELQTRQATEETVERPLEKGDILVADLQRFDEGGVLIIGERFEDRTFLIGEEGGPSPEFEEALIGISTGESRRVDFSYRADLGDEELAGKQERFEVMAKEVKERTLPELDDEFAKDLGEEFQNLDDLRRHISAQIERRWDYMSRQKLRNDTIDELIKKNRFELPKAMVDNYVESTRREQGHDADHDHDHDHDADHDHDHDADHDAGQEDPERTTAIRRLRGYLIVEALRKQLQIAVDDEEFDEFLQQRAGEMGQQAEELKRSEQVDSLRRELEENKLFDLLIERAQVEEQTV